MLGSAPALWYSELMHSGVELLMKATRSAPVRAAKSAGVQLSTARDLNRAGEAASAGSSSRRVAPISAGGSGAAGSPGSSEPVVVVGAVGAAGPTGPAEAVVVVGADPAVATGGAAKAWAGSTAVAVAQQATTPAASTESLVRRSTPNPSSSGGSPTWGRAEGRRFGVDPVIDR